MLVNETSQAHYSKGFLAGKKELGGTVWVEKKIQPAGVLN